MSCATTSVTAGGGGVTATTSPAFTLAFACVSSPFSVTSPQSISRCTALRERPLAEAAKESSLWPSASGPTSNSSVSVISPAKVNYSASPSPCFSSGKTAANSLCPLFVNMNMNPSSSAPTVTKISATLNTGKLMNSVHIKSRT